MFLKLPEKIQSLTSNVISLISFCRISITNHVESLSKFAFCIKLGTGTKDHIPSYTGKHTAGCQKKCEETLLFWKRV